MKTIVEGQVEGKNVKGRLRTKYMEQVKKDVEEKKYLGVKRFADRIESWIKPILGLLTSDDDDDGW